MKQLTRICVLAATVAVIIGCWLLPGVNTAKPTDYVRMYEDTETKPSPVEKLQAKFVNNETQTSDTSKRMQKKYKEERIRSNMKLKLVTPKMYSRSMQFEEMILLDKDSIPNRLVVRTDSIGLPKLIPQDSIARFLARQMLKSKNIGLKE